MTPMRTTEDFKKEVFDVNPNFEILSEYNGLRKRLPGNVKYAVMYVKYRQECCLIIVGVKHVLPLSVE